MNKLGAEVWEKQDEELYALLEKAMSEDKRLTVSEELIQKTLKRVEETSVKTDLTEKSYKKFYRPLRYAGMAAAAVLVLVIGVKAVGNGGFMSKDGMKAESAPGNSMNSMRADSVMEAEVYDGSTKGTAGLYRYSCEGETGVVSEASKAYDALNSTASANPNFDMVSDSCDEVIKSFEAVEQITLSEKFLNALSSLGYTIIGEDAVYRVFDSAEVENLESQITEKLESMRNDDFYVSEENESVSPYFDANGVLVSEVPLQAGIRVQTDKGMLWVLLGDVLYLVCE